MFFQPVRLGPTALPAETVTADKNACRHFGPCGVGKEALYLNSYFLDRRYYVALADVRRVFKRVAMSKGGFTGSGLFGSIPYLVVEYGGQKMAVDAPLDFVLAHPDNFWHVEQVLPEVPNEPCFKANVRVTSKDFSRALEVRDALAARFASMEFTCPMPGVGHLDLTPKGFGK